MKMKMKITVIIPVYKVEKYIQACLESVIHQSYEGNIECLLVDDCSPDNSCEIIEAIVKNYKGNIQFKLLHHTNNRGLSAARNTGMENATGDYILFLDSDDRITEDCIEKLAAPLDNYRYDFVVGDYKTEPEDPSLWYAPLTMDKGAYFKDKILSAYVHKIYYGMAWNKLCSKTFLLQYKLFFKEGLLHEDELWSCQMACKAKSMYVVKAVTYVYSIRPGSIMTTGSLKLHWSAVFQVAEGMLDCTTQQNKTQKELLYPFILLYIKRILHGTYLRGTHDEFLWGYATARRLFFRIPYLSYWKGKLCSRDTVSIIHFFLPPALGRPCYKLLRKLVKN